jgi:tetratricopeptide (TPR) repeat protein
MRRVPAPALLLLGLAIAAASAAAHFWRSGRFAERLASGKGRSVLLVTLDTTRADRLGCYGHPGARTPILDRLASEGVRFENAFADAPITLPSHASLLTALYPFEHGVRNNGNFRLSERPPTLATALRDRGYRTAAFLSSFVLDRRYGLARGFETYDDRMDAAPESAPFPEAERRGDRTVLALGRWLEGRAADGAPFFAWLHLYDAHEPYRPPPPFRETIADPYDGEIAFADAALGQALDKLGTLGLRDKTVVAVVADHGESLGDHGEETHSMFVYDSVIRVPLIFWGPGLLPAGRTIGAPVRTIDVAPTLLDLVEAPPLASPHARSLRGLIQGRSAAPPPAVYAETYVPQLYMNGAPLRAVRDERYKLIDAPRPELYDLARDPGESQDRYRDEPKIAAALRLELDRLTGGSPGAMSTGPVDAEAAEKLRALGYVGAGSEPLRTSRAGLKDPKDLVAVFNRLRRADEAVRARRFPEALALLEAVKAEDPRNAFARQLLGSAQLGSRRFARALEEFRAYAALVPGSAQAHQWMAVCHANLGDLASALREAGAALVLDPRLRDARLLRAGLLAAQGRSAEAAEELRAALDADPDDSTLRLSFAEVLAAKGSLADAEREYRRVVADDPALRDEARLGLAAVLGRQRRTAEARAELERIAQSPDAAAELRQAARRQLSGSGER